VGRVGSWIFCGDISCDVIFLCAYYFYSSYFSCAHSVDFCCALSGCEFQLVTSKRPASRAAPPRPSCRPARRRSSRAAAALGGPLHEPDLHHDSGLGPRQLAHVLGRDANTTRPAACAAGPPGRQSTGPRSLGQAVFGQEMDAGRERQDAVVESDQFALLVVAHSVHSVSALRVMAG
jgi:hypothetical protein